MVRVLRGIFTLEVGAQALDGTTWTVPSEFSKVCGLTLACQIRHELCSLRPDETLFSSLVVSLIHFLDFSWLHKLIAAYIEDLLRAFCKCNECVFHKITVSEFCTMHNFYDSTHCQKLWCPEEHCKERPQAFFHVLLFCSTCLGSVSRYN